MKGESKKEGRFYCWQNNHFCKTGGHCNSQYNLHVVVLRMSRYGPSMLWSFARSKARFILAQRLCKDISTKLCGDFNTSQLPYLWTDFQNSFFLWKLTANAFQCCSARALLGTFETKLEQMTSRMPFLHSPFFIGVARLLLMLSKGLLTWSHHHFPVSPSAAL